MNDALSLTIRPSKPRRQGLVVASSWLCPLIEIFPTEADMMFGLVSSHRYVWAALLRVIFCWIILGPLLAYRRANPDFAIRELLASRSRISIVLLIVAAKAALAVALILNDAKTAYQTPRAMSGIPIVQPRGIK